MTNRIDLSLTALKHRIKKHGLIEVQLEGGKLFQTSFSFNAPAQETEIKEFFKSNNWHAPVDYLSFLRQHNGATLFSDSNHGGGMLLFGLNDIAAYRKDYHYMFPPNCYPIGMLNSAMIYIDSEIARNSSSGYLYWQDCIGTHDTGINLLMNFETFLELFIIAQGSEFWFWPSFKPQ